jgi:very-short-patch-repair endonuclease
VYKKTPFVGQPLNYAIEPYVVDLCSPEHKLIIELDGGQFSACPVFVKMRQ